MIYLGKSLLTKENKDSDDTSCRNVADAFSAGENSIIYIHISDGAVLFGLGNAQYRVRPVTSYHWGYGILKLSSFDFDARPLVPGP